MTELAPLVETVGKLGPVGLLIVAMWALITGRLRLARECERLEKELERERAEKEKWERLAVRGLDVAKSISTAVVAQSAPNSPPGN
jgi:hypothetical protein